MVGKKGALWAGVGGNCSSGMDGLKSDNEAISRAWKRLLLWRISILGGAFKQEKARCLGCRIVLFLHRKFCSVSGAGDGVFIPLSPLWKGEKKNGT